MAEISKGVIEVRKKVVYQKDYKARVLVMYYVLSQYESIDQKLMKLEFWDRENTRYTSFKVIDTNVYLGTFHLNNLINIDTKYKVLENMNVHNMIVE